MMNIDRQSTDDTEDTFVTAETIKWSAWHHTMMKSGIAIDNGLWSCYVHPTNDDFPKFAFIIYSFCTCWMAFLAFTASNMLSELMRLCFWITTLNPQLVTWKGGRGVKGATGHQTTTKLFITCSCNEGAPNKKNQSKLLPRHYMYLLFDAILGAYDVCRQTRWDGCPAYDALNIKKLPKEKIHAIDGCDTILSEPRGQACRPQWRGFIKICQRWCHEGEETSLQLFWWYCHL